MGEEEAGRFVELALALLRRRLEEALLAGDDDALNALARDLLIVEHAAEEFERSDLVERVRELRRVYVKAVVARGLAGYTLGGVRRGWRRRSL